MEAGATGFVRREDLECLKRSGCPATSGLSPVEKTNDRARFQSQAMSGSAPATNAPAEPNAFPELPHEHVWNDPGFGAEPAPRRTKDAESVGLVHDERRAVRIAEAAEREEARGSRRPC